MGALSSIPALGNPVTPKQFYRAGKGVVVAGDTNIVVTSDDATGKLILTAPGVEGGAATAVWGGITGTLSDQSDLQTALNSAASTATWAGLSGKPTTLAGYGITDAAPLSGAAFTGGVGYDSAAYTAVVQPTSKSTAVTVDAPSGRITMSNAALAAGALVTFIVNNATVQDTDAIILVLKGGNVSNIAYRYGVTRVQNGSFSVTVENRTTGSLSEALIFNFAVIQTNR